MKKKDMNMQDKELDALFRDNLENMEVEPSANLWAGIAAGLDQPETKKRPLVQYLSIAATIVVLITAGILFIPKHKPKQQGTAMAKVKTRPVKKAVEIVPAAPQPEAAPLVKTESKAEQIAVIKQASPKVEKVEAVVKQPAEVTVTELPHIVQQQQAIAAVTPKTDNPNPVVPDNDVPLSQKNIQTETEPFKNKPVVMAQANLSKAETQQVQPEKKKRSRGLGGLLSSLVAKIDKREDKLVEFDENQKLTGINLGILKITTEQE
ncbi:hypothetical protein EOD41_13895 [Mucilaginibacter limnophilus]|uniref:Uncharacterized protein n=1 Tax=Mucilaginibacter limnophilus TaxID=1932778 RepID=A0A3S2V720_9SPHI|nr:hypothetical protein [Mucilaginibacter limnophilus]RVU00048.1 hypothetical protein EOD41_13895 [Mucilaginibacter limnophilus]